MSKSDFSFSLDFRGSFNRETWQKVYKNISDFIVQHDKPFVILGLLFGVFPLYVWINEYSSGRPAHNIAIFIDHLVPFDTRWEFVYAGLYFAMFFPLCVIRDRLLIRRIGLAYALCFFLSYPFFLLFPTRMIRVPFEIDSLHAWGTMLNYYLEAPQNCFPSGHIALSFLVSFILMSVSRIRGTIALTIALLIAYSTMAVKQHFFLDIPSGILLSYLVFHFSIKKHLREKLQNTPRSELLYPTALIVLPFICYALMVAIFYFLYIGGFRPWEHV